MGVSCRSLAVVLGLLILCSSCATQRWPAASLPAGTSVEKYNGTNTIPPGTNVVPNAKKHFAGAQ